MQTVATARHWAAEQFKNTGIEFSSLSADRLLGFALKWDRVRLLSHSEETLTDESWTRFQSLIGRHIAGEPIQYLTGEQEFYGLAFRVTPAVLIPRPETEILVEEALTLIRNCGNSTVRIADVGTGSGCIAIAIAHQVAGANCWAIDISAPALRLAKENAVRHGTINRIHFVQSDLLDCFSPVPQFDFILCNPPYVALAECDSLPSSVRDHEPHTALFGGDSGLEVYRRLVPQIVPRLVPNGYFLIEIGAGQAVQAAEIIEKAGLSLQTVLNDLRQIPRCVVGRKLPGGGNG
jgi:release factor glutamine methyltransferase